MRIGECSSLLHSDLIGRSYEGTANFYHNNIGHKVVQQIQLRKRAVKGKHARSVVLSERVRREIVQYFMSLADIDVKAPLCVGYKGQMSNKTLALQHRDWMCELGLYGAFSHSGRRRFVTNFLERGTNIRTV
jgi:integrase/recombinase XerD